jgi:MFS family permease
VLGGVIVQRASWRWIYLFNAPAAAVAIPAIALAWPAQPLPKSRTRIALFTKLDALGALLLLVASVLLVFAIQEAGALRFKWNSTVIVVCLVISGICWCGFTAWVSWLSSSQTKLQMQPIFPLSAALRRPTGPAIL